MVSKRLGTMQIGVIVRIFQAGPVVVPIAQLAVDNEHNIVEYGGAIVGKAKEGFKVAATSGIHGASRDFRFVLEYAGEEGQQLKLHFRTG